MEEYYEKPLIMPNIDLFMKPFPRHIKFSNPSWYHIEGSVFEVGDLVWFEVDDDKTRGGRAWGQARIVEVLPDHRFKLMGRISGIDVHNHPDLQEVPGGALFRMWDGTEPECPVPSIGAIKRNTSNTNTPVSLEETQRRYGPDLGFCGAKQSGLGPEMCGITLNQLRSVMDLPQFDPSMTMLDVVQKLVIPITKGTGLSYALLLNQKRPLRATHMVSHAWTERYVDFIEALLDSELPDNEAMWVCAMAIYQCEDIPALTIQRQLGHDVSRGPFATVLKQADSMLALLTPHANIYTRMWCVLEMFVAVQLGVPVRLLAHWKRDSCFQTGSDVRMDDAAVQHGQKRCDSKSARCGDPLDPNMNSDERAIRDLIERSDGYDVIDSAVEWIKAMYLIERSRKINFGGLTMASASHPLLMGGYVYFMLRAQHLSAVANAIYRIRNKDSPN